MTDSPVEISDRELEILQLVAKGATNQQIAQQLNISTNTVKVHLRNINTKIGASSRTEATLYAVRKGWVRVDDGPDDDRPDDDRPDDDRPDNDRPDNELTDSTVVAVAEPASSTAEAQAVPDSLAAASQTMQSTADSMQDTAPAVPRRAISGHTLAIALGIVALLLVAAAGLLMWMDWPASESPPSRPTADEPSSTPSFPLINTTERWRELAPLPDARSGFALAGLRSDGSQYLYVIGGSAGADVSSEVWRYTIAQDTWVERTAMPIAVSDVQAATIGSKIYVPGGRLASGEITSTLAVYDPRLDSWETRAPLPEPRSGYALAAFEGKLYLFGGWDGSSYRAEVWQYNPDQDTWIERTPMPTARAFTGAALLAERIHVLGGEAESGPLATHEQYTPADEDNPGSAWKTLTPMPVSISNMAVAASGERLFAISGQDASHPLIVYNNRLDAWETQELPLAPRADLRVQEFDNALYIIGGRSSAGDQNQVFRYQAVYTIVFPFD